MGHALRLAGVVVALGGGLILNAGAGDAQGCARPNVPAMIVHAVEPDVPAMAQQQGISGTVQVMVSLDATNRVTGTRLMSSPSAVLNAAALFAARQSTYQTEIRECVPIASNFVFAVRFAAEPTISAGDGRPTAVISAHGVASRPPDVAYLAAAIITNDDVAATSTAKNEAIYTAVRDRLKRLGADEPALRTTYFGVGFLATPAPAPDGAGGTPAPYRAPVSVPRYGYITTRQISVTLVDVSKAGPALDALLAAGVTNAGYVRFELLDRRAAYAEALAAALEDASEQARIAAQASHMQIAGIKQIVVGQNLLGPPTPAPGPPMYPNPATGTVSTNVHPVPVEVQATVTVTYFFKP